MTTVRIVSSDGCPFDFQVYSPLTPEEKAALESRTGDEIRELFRQAGFDQVALQ